MKAIFLASVLTLLALSGPARPADPVTAIAGSASTALVLNEVKSMLTDTIDTATNRADYITFRAATQMKSVIDSWEKANSNLLNQTFDRLNDSERRFISDAQLLVAQLNDTASNQMEAATKITELANQTVADARFWDGNLGVLRYTPRVIHPAMTDDIRFVLRGVNFDKNDPALLLPDGTAAERVALLKQEAVFLVPQEVFKRSMNKVTLTPFKLTYNESRTFLMRLMRAKPNRRVSDLTAMVLPNHIGSFELNIKDVIPRTHEWEGSREFGLSGKDANQIFNQAPHDNDWKLRLASIREGAGRGKAGKGCALESSSEHGFSVRIKTGRISTWNNPNAPGYQYCWWHWTEFKTTNEEQNLPAVSGVIPWNTDTLLTMSETHKAYVLTVKASNSITRVFSGSGNGGPFYEVLEQGNSVIIKPKVPVDLNAN